MTPDITHADTHRPTEAFRDFLDEEIHRAFGHHALRRRLRLAAVIMVSVAIGTTGGLASAQIREGSQRDSLLDAARADAALVSMRVDLARAQLAEQRRAVAVGAMSTETAAGAVLQLKDVESQLARASLNIDEIKASGRAPRDELNAPLVNGHDFVKDRILAQAMAAQVRMQTAESAQTEVARRVRAGVVSELANQEAELDVARAQREILVISTRIQLRKEFLEKQTPVDQLLQQLVQAELRADLGVAQRALSVARARAATLDKRRAAGVGDELELMRAQLEMKEREVELQRLLQRLGKK
ncbi:MAG: hypothetical protein ABI625_08880 [bacterium]